MVNWKAVSLTLLKRPAQQVGVCLQCQNIRHKVYLVFSDIQFPEIALEVSTFLNMPVCSTKQYVILCY